MSILGSLKRELGGLDLVIAWLHVRGMVNVISGFTQTTNVVNGFSDLILKLYGREVGMHARSAVGVQSLALDVPVIMRCSGNKSSVIIINHPTLKLWYPNEQ
jgi:hypothetical protein